MRILVTGGAGFIGSHVVDGYLAEGHEVSVVDDLSHGQEAHLNPQAQFHRVDLLDFKSLEKVFREKQPEILNHHAARVDVREAVEDPLFDARVNILGSLHLLELSRRYGVQKVIYISSGGAIYGEPDTLPVREDHPIRPLSPYGASKYAVEPYLSLYGRLFGLRFTVLRYPNVYGPRQDPRGEAGVVAIFCRQMFSGERPTIFGDGTKTRDYVYVEDIVRANLQALGPKGEMEAFNLGWGREISDLEVFKAAREALGVEVEPVFGEPRPGEVSRICLDAQRAQKVLDWKPLIPFREGVRKTVSYFKSLQE